MGRQIRDKRGSAGLGRALPSRPVEHPSMPGSRADRPTVPVQPRATAPASRRPRNPPTQRPRSRTMGVRGNQRRPSTVRHQRRPHHLGHLRVPSPPQGHRPLTATSAIIDSHQRTSTAANLCSKSPSEDRAGLQDDSAPRIVMVSVSQVRIRALESPTRVIQLVSSSSGAS